MLQGAIDGHGILLARRSIAAAEIERGTLVALFGISTPSSSSYWIVRPEAPAPSPRAVAFRDWLFAEVAADTARATAAAKRGRAIRRRG